MAQSSNLLAVKTGYNSSSLRSLFKHNEHKKTSSLGKDGADKGRPFVNLSKTEFWRVNPFNCTGIGTDFCREAFHLYLHLCANWRSPD